MEHRELPADQISISIDTNEIEELQKSIELPDVIGQPRALRALQMGTEIRGRGYNIFVTGQSGTGRTTSIKKVLSQYESKDVPLKDIVFVFNFLEPDYPQVLYLEQGQGRAFKHAVHQLVEDMKGLIRKKLDSDSYKQERDRLIGMIEQEENHALTDFEEKINGEGFKLVHIHEEDSESTDIVPVYEGRAVDFEQLQKLVQSGELSNDYWNKARERYYQLMDEMRHLFQELKDGRAALEKELESLQIETVTPGVEEEVDRLREHYTEQAVNSYLEGLKNDIVHHLFLFLREQPTDDSGNPALVRYGVNVLVDNSNTKTVPIIFEHHPTATNLFGTIESRLDLNGQSRSTFMMIKAGSLVRASGGFLVLNAQDILRDEDLWDQLKRVLQTEQVEIQPSEHVVSFQYTMMKPQPIKIDTKVIVVGTENLYDYLYNQDTDFHKHFKISAEFDSVMPLSQDNLARYIGLSA
ncbi:MAG: AAA family ATPase [Spirochaetota bacterium]